MRIGLIRTRNTENDDYYFWLISFIEDSEFDPTCYQLLLEKLYFTEFIPVIHRDENRLEDGIGLYSLYTKGLDIPFDGPYITYHNNFCSILEMMIGLAKRIEDDIMYDPDEGDRTGFWFWVMIKNLGLLDSDDDNFNESYVDTVIFSFLNRKYEKDGHGGLFITENPHVNMRDLEIWYQANNFLDEFFIEIW